jgi:hypothetical protein
MENQAGVFDAPTSASVTVMSKKRPREYLTEASPATCGITTRSPRVIGGIDVLQMQVTECTLDPETISVDGIAMGAADNESHLVPSRSQPPAEIAPDCASCHNRYPHVSA